MQRMKFSFIVLSVFALALLPILTTGQSTVGDRIIYPPEFSPLKTMVPAQEERPLIPPTKFVKLQNAIPNHYIVVLNDDVVASDAPLEERRARITAIANSHAQAHHGKVGYIYETALKGYSIELPNEAAAIAISQNPQVKFVEEDAIAQFMEGAVRTNPRSPQCSACHH